MEKFVILRQFCKSKTNTDHLKINIITNRNFLNGRFTYNFCFGEKIKISGEIRIAGEKTPNLESLRRAFYRFKFFTQGLSIYAENFCGTGLVAAYACKNIFDIFVLHLGKSPVETFPGQSREAV